MRAHTMTFILSILLTAHVSYADTLQYTTANGAIDGYDPVSYFTDAKAERGSPDISTEWNGATWHFSSKEHRNSFVADPEKYAPQYGGFCALGMAHGGDVPTNPEAWTIYDDKLYLNMITEVSVTWRYNPDKLIPRAGTKWEALNSKP